MEQLNGKQHLPNTPEQANRHPRFPGDTPAHAPATLLPAVLQHIGLDQAQSASPLTLTFQEALANVRSQHWQQRVRAVRALGTFGGQAAIEPLLFALQDEDESVRAAAIAALAPLGERVPIAPLVAALHDPAWHVRETAILTLVQRREELPADVFDEVLHDSDNTVREAVFLAIQWTRQRSVLPHLQGTSAPSIPTNQPIIQLQDMSQAGSQQHMQPQQMQAISSYNSLFTKNNNGKRNKKKDNQRGASMREDRTQPAMQNPEYAYYGYNDDELNRRWEKVTSYAPKKNRKPLWIGGILGVAMVCIVAAGTWTLFANNVPVPQIDYLQKPVAMPQVTPMPGFPALTVFVYQNHRAPVNAVVWSPDSTRIASASDDTTVQVWDALTGNNPYTFKDHITPVETLAWSPNGQLIASGSADGTIEVWDPNNGRVDLIYHFSQAADIAHIGALQASSGGYVQGTYVLAWSPDGSRIAAVMNSSVVRVFDAHNGNTMFSYASSSAKILAMAWSPNGNYIITAGANDTTNIWSADNGNSVLATKVSSASVFSLAWSLDSKRVAIGYVDGTVELWDPFSGSSQAVRVPSQNAYALAWSPDNTLLAMASIGGTVQFVNTATDKLSFVYSGHINELRSMAWSPDGSFIAFGSSDDTVQVWKAPY